MLRRAEEGDIIGKFKINVWWHIKLDAFLQNSSALVIIYRVVLICRYITWLLQNSLKKQELKKSHSSVRRQEAFFWLSGLCSCTYKSSRVMVGCPGDTFRICVCVCVSWQPKEPFFPLKNKGHLLLLLANSHFSPFSFNGWQWGCKCSPIKIVFAVASSKEHCRRQWPCRATPL